MSGKINSTRIRRQAGFTLIELMITVVVAAILAAIAIPSYMSQIRKSRRTEARTALLDIAGREERYFSVSNAYSQNPNDVGYGSAGNTWNYPTGLPVGSGYYNVTVQSPDPNFTGTSPSYVVKATATGTQTADSCSTFSVNQLGQQTATGSDPNANTNCWQ